MGAKQRGNQGAPTEAGRRDGGSEAGVLDVEQVLAEVRHHLDNGRPERAAEAIRRSGLKSPWLTNALGVCQLRLGNGGVAVEVFRGLVLKDSIHVRDDAPPVFKLNFAAALLAAGNLDGFLSALGEVGEGEHPAARRYREAYRAWKAGLTWWQRLKSLFVGRPDPPYGLGTALGDL